MCMLSDKPLVPFVSREDIIVYKKVLKMDPDRVSSIHLYYDYHKGNREIKVKIEPSFLCGKHKISQGYHSFKNSKDARSFVGSIYSGAVFIIPKGYLYYIGFDNDEKTPVYVSESISYLGILKYSPKLDWFMSRYIYYKAKLTQWLQK